MGEKFLNNAGEDVQNLIKTCEKANESYKKVEKYFGGYPFGDRIYNHENRHMWCVRNPSQSIEFLEIMYKFIDLYKKSEQEIDTWDEMKQRKQAIKEKQQNLKKSNKRRLSKYKKQLAKSARLRREKLLNSSLE